MKDLPEGDIVGWKSEYVVVESLVVQEVHGIIHCGSNMKGRRYNMIGMGFKGIQVDLGQT